MQKFFMLYLLYIITLEVFLHRMYEIKRFSCDILVIELKIIQLMVRAFGSFSQYIHNKNSDLHLLNSKPHETIANG